MDVEAGSTIAHGVEPGNAREARRRLVLRSRRRTMFRCMDARAPRRQWPERLRVRVAARPWLALAGLALALGPSPGCGAEGAPLIVLITVDTLRADHLGAYGAKDVLTPHIDAFADRSTVFAAAYAPTSFTLPSIAALLTGRYPEELGIVSNRSALPASVPTLATRLRAAGWSTAAVVSNLVLRRNSGLAQGFDRYDDAMEDREAVRDWPERTAGATTDAALAALEALEAQGKPALLWIHYQDPHGPYTPPAGWRERHIARERAAPDGTRRLPERLGRGGHGHLPTYQEIDGEREVAFYRAGYAGEVGFLDQEVGRVFDALETRGSWPRTTAILTADHGEALGESDYWFAHGDRLAQGLVRVPLIIRRPGHAAARRGDPVSPTSVATHRRPCRSPSSSCASGRPDPPCACADRRPRAGRSPPVRTHRVRRRRCPRPSRA